jgi:hypothetical protein
MKFNILCHLSKILPDVPSSMIHSSEKLRKKSGGGGGHERKPKSIEHH